MKRFRGGLVFKAHRLGYHSTLGSRVIKKKKKMPPAEATVFLFDAFTHLPSETKFFIDNLLIQFHFVIVKIRWTGLAPCEAGGRDSGFRASGFEIQDSGVFGFRAWGVGKHKAGVGV